jgi:apolipoprotein N-acyltransferase
LSRSRSLAILVVVSFGLTAVGAVLIWITLGMGPGLSVLITAVVFLASGLLVARRI